MKLEWWLQKNTRQLKTAGIASARLDCLLLLEDELNQPRSWLLAHNETKLTKSQLIKLNTKVAQRSQRQPLAYLRGQQSFYGRQFKVTPAVLIPRPESEVMIELLLRHHQATNPSLTMVDIGTGSGCLAVTAQLELPTATVVATDISPAALNVAWRNARQLKAPIQLHQADLLQLPPAAASDILLVNLPYVPTGLVTSPEINHEPASALFAGADGLDLYRQLWRQLIQLPTPPAVIFCESLPSQHPALKQLARKAGYRLSAQQDLIQQFSYSR